MRRIIINNRTTSVLDAEATDFVLQVIRQGFQSYREDGPYYYAVASFPANISRAQIFVACSKTKTGTFTFTIQEGNKK